MNNALRAAGFYTRVSLLFPLRTVIRLAGLFGRRAREAMEWACLVLANRLFRAPMDTAMMISLQSFYEAQDPSDFFTLCQEAGLGNDWFRGKRILDAGCGIGRISAAVAGTGAMAVDGIDLNEPYIRFAKEAAQRLGLQNVSFSCQSIYRIEFLDNHFDAAYSYAVFEHLDDIPRALSEIHRVLKPGAQLVIQFHSYRTRYGAHLGPFVRVPWPYAFFSEDTLIRFWNTEWARYARSQGLAAHQELFQSPETFRTLNRLTLSEAEALIRASPLRLVAAAPYSAEELLLQLLPRAQRTKLYEYLRGSCVFLLEKPAGDTTAEAKS
jgi:ubiquinone/menaquinone biosynthesis C-methylase UbiE